QSVWPALARHGVIRRAERAPEDGVDAEQRKIIPRYELAGDLFDLAVYVELRILRSEGGEAGEGLIPVAEPLEAWVRRRAAFRTSWPHVLNKVELLRPFDWQHLQQHRVNQTEYRRVRADAQRQRNRSHNRKAFIFEQHSHSVTQVLKHFVLQEVFFPL